MLRNLWLVCMIAVMIEKLGDVIAMVLCFSIGVNLVCLWVW